MKPASEYITATRQFFGDGEYWLMLRMVQAIELEKQRGIVMSRTYGQLLADLYEDEGKLKLFGHADIPPATLNQILRLALIGGNSGPDHGEGTEVGPQRAEQLIALYAYPERPIEEVAAVVFRVLHAAMVGDPAQREALPDQAAESDERSAKLNEQVGERLGPTMRKRAEEAAA
jgi:hypothetical protein